MKHLFTFLAICLTISINAQSPCSNGSAAGYPCDVYGFQDRLSPAQMGNSAEAQDSWGWTDSTTGKEYAIVALDDGTAFVDISNPTNIVYLGRLDSHTGSSYWRDVKVYNDHAFIVSDSNGNHGMQIFDLRRLRPLNGSNPTAMSNDGRITWGTSNSNRGQAHNIFISEDSGHAYVLGVKHNSGGPVVIKLDTDGNGEPQDPSIVYQYSSIGYVHDAQVLTYNGPDTEHHGKEIMIASSTTSNLIHVLDFSEIVDNDSNTNTVNQIGSVGYTGSEYAHQGWFTENQKYFIVGDELDEPNYGFTRTFVFDMTNLDNPQWYYTKNGATAATDHNGYVKGNRFYLANYTNGMNVFKLDKLDNPMATRDMELVGNFDTYTASNNVGTIGGAWNVYPFFESGNLVITGFGSNGNSGGLYIVKDPNFDNTPPVINAQNIIATLAHTGAVDVDAIDVDNGSTDDQGITIRMIDDQETLTFTCDDLGDQVVTYRLEDDYGNVSTQQVTVTVVARETTWNGSTWSGVLEPGPGSNANVNQIYNTQDDGPINSCECNVTTNGQLTVAADTYIEIQKDITVVGSLTVEHTGNVVQTDADAEVFNFGNIQVKLTTPALDPRDFMLLGSPMTANGTGVYNNPSQLFKHTTENFDPYTGMPAVNGVNFIDNDTNDYSPQTANLNPGEGYLVRPSFTVGGTYNYTYDEGTLNSGPITYEAYYGDSKNDSPNILANPYASALDATKFIQDNPAVSEVYFWEHNITPSSTIPGPNSSNFSMEDVSMYNGTMGVGAASGGSVPNGVIATGQGFGIKANNPGGTITFTNDMRLTSGNTTLRATDDARELLWITISEEDYDLSSTAGIGFLPAASNAYDVGFDSDRLGTVISLFSHLEDGTEQLGIQGLRSFDENKEIPLGFESLIEDPNHSYKISLDNFEGGQLENVYVFLLDKATGTRTNLSKKDYTFTETNGVYNNRFTLYFTQKTFGIENEPLDAIVLYPNPVDNVFTITSPLAQIENFNFYDARGRRVINVVEESNTSYTLDISSLETGIYYIEVITNIGSITKKIVKK